MNSLSVVGQMKRITKQVRHAVRVRDTHVYPDDDGVPYEAPKSRKYNKWARLVDKLMRKRDAWMKRNKIEYGNQRPKKVSSCFIYDIAYLLRRQAVINEDYAKEVEEKRSLSFADQAARDVEEQVIEDGMRAVML